MSSPTVLRPNTELIAVAWLGSIPGLVPGMVSTTLPDDNSSWAASGFVVITGAGGSPDPDVPMRAPIVGVDTWAIAPTSNKPPWGQACNLAERIVQATWTIALIHRRVELPGAFPMAFIHSVIARTEPRRVPGDPGGAAHYSLNLDFRWTALS